MLFNKLFIWNSTLAGHFVFYLATLLSLWPVSFTQYNVLRFIHAVYQEMLPFSLLSSMPLCGEGNGTPLQYSCLENPVDGGTRWAAVHGVTEGLTWLSNFTFTFHFHALKKEMATHFSILAWRIPGTGSLVGCHLWGCTELDMTEVT